MHTKMLYNKHKHFIGIELSNVKIGIINIMFMSRRLNSGKKNYVTKAKNMRKNERKKKERNGKGRVRERVSGATVLEVNVIGVTFEF